MLALSLSACNDDNDANVGKDQDGVPREFAVTQARRYQVSPYAFDEGAAEIVAHDPRK